MRITVAFRGFDGNEESEFYSVANILIKKMKRWGRFLERDLNSHAPMLSEYRGMLDRWPSREELVNLAMRDGGLTRDQLKDIIGI